MGHLVGTREILWDDSAVGYRLEREVGLATVVVRNLTQSEQRSCLSPRDINNVLNGSVSVI